MQPSNVKRRLEDLTWAKSRDSNFYLINIPTKEHGRVWSQRRMNKEKAHFALIPKLVALGSAAILLIVQVKYRECWWLHYAKSSRVQRSYLLQVKLLAGPCHYPIFVASGDALGGTHYLVEELVGRAGMGCQCHLTITATDHNARRVWANTRIWCRVLKYRQLSAKMPAVIVI